MSDLEKLEAERKARIEAIRRDCWREALERADRFAVANKTQGFAIIPKADHG